MGVKLYFAYCMFHWHAYHGFLPRNRMQYYTVNNNIYFILSMYGRKWEKYTLSTFLRNSWEREHVNWIFVTDLANYTN